MIFAIVLSVLLNVLLLTALGFAVYYLWRFSRIIMLLEDDFSDAIEGLELIEQSLQKILGMQLFFDSKEVKLIVQEAMGEVKTGRIAVNRLIQKFVDRSKQKYVVVQEEEPTMPMPEGPGPSRLPDPSMVDVRFMSSTAKEE